MSDSIYTETKSSNMCHHSLDSIMAMSKILDISTNHKGRDNRYKTLNTSPLY